MLDSCKYGEAGCTKITAGAVGSSPAMLAVTPEPCLEVVLVPEMEAGLGVVGPMDTTSPAIRRLAWSVFVPALECGLLEGVLADGKVSPVSRWPPWSPFVLALDWGLLNGKASPAAHSLDVCLEEALEEDGGTASGSRKPFSMMDANAMSNDAQGRDSARRD
mmetsp:Transcript_2812/g.8668  ORF Transcript_2812/g.8668 Transcript_2812/m.8668 type:complete len:162 (-) Transcript_2812:3-488(-)